MSNVSCHLNYFGDIVWILLFLWEVKALLVERHQRCQNIKFTGENSWFLPYRRIQMYCCWLKPFQTITSILTEFCG